MCNIATPWHDIDAGALAIADDLKSSSTNVPGTKHDWDPVNPLVAHVST